MLTSSRHYLATVYGLSGAVDDDWTPAQRVAYGRALVAIAAADGLSFAEREFVRGHMTALGVPAEGVQAVLDQDGASADIAELVGPLKDHAMGPRCLVYDAIKLCSADGYAANERAAVDRAAAVLGLEVAVVRQLEAAVTIDIAARHLRHALLAP